MHSKSLAITTRISTTSSSTSLQCSRFSQRMLSKPLRNSLSASLDDSCVFASPVQRFASCALTPIPDFHIHSVLSSRILLDILSNSSHMWRRNRKLVNGCLRALAVPPRLVTCTCVQCQRPIRPRNGFSRSDTRLISWALSTSTTSQSCSDKPLRTAGPRLLPNMLHCQSHNHNLGTVSSTTNLFWMILTTWPKSRARQAPIHAAWL